MNEHEMAKALFAALCARAHKETGLATALTEWARLWLANHGTKAAKKEWEWDELASRVAKLKLSNTDENDPCHPIIIAARLADMLTLDRFDAGLLRWLIACNRLPDLVRLIEIAAENRIDLPMLLGELAGARPVDAARAVRASAVMRFDLVSFARDWRGGVEIDIRWTLERVLDRAPATADAMTDLLAGERRPARLMLSDFAASEDIRFIAALLKGAVDTRAAGVNILLHGPPGTGKTELACALAGHIAVPLHAVGEADTDGTEPSRRERVAALQIAQRLLGNKGGALLLFDEMEDMIGNVQRSSGDWMSGREGSKVFVNRALETNPVPVIWTTNAIDNIDGAILRRMSFILKCDIPSRATARRIADRIAHDEGVALDEQTAALLDRVPEAATVMRVAARATQLAGDEFSVARAAEALVRPLKGALLPLDGLTALDPDLFESDPPIPDIVAAMTQGDADVSLLLTGPPGTGKTALAHHLAREMDRPLLTKRASDLLSRWVGGTEEAIANAFAEARKEGGLLFLDEADSLLFDRTTARTNWEVSQVNELLTWLDQHPLPVVAATNHGWKLDPATLRRFLFKVDLKPLGAAKCAQAFKRNFGMEAPVDLAEITNLTPGDFALVARQLRRRPETSAMRIVNLLRQEAACKPESGTAIGF